MACRFYMWTELAFDHNPASPYFPFADARNQCMAARRRVVYGNRINRDVDKLENSMAAKLGPGVGAHIKEFADPEHFSVTLRLE